jgi:Zn-dependent M28 family amino/carboxypeptidase
VAHFAANTDRAPYPAYPGARGRLERDVRHLAGDLGERNVYRRPDELKAAHDWIRTELQVVANVEPARTNVPSRPINVELDQRVGPLKVSNVVAEHAADPGIALNEVIIVGAHYDTMTYSPEWAGTDHDRITPQLPGTPGANDNASGVAALLEIARQLQGKPLRRTVRFVAFANEEPPFFQERAAMGSFLYARECQGQPIAMMVALDALALYSEDGTHQKRPWWKGWFASLRGLHRRPDYVAFMSNWDAGSGPLTVDWAKTFHDSADVDVRTISLPFIPAFGTEVFAWSDDWSFTRHGIPAFTVTDTAFLRSDRYHDARDTPDALTTHDYDVFAQVVTGLARMIETKAMQTTPLLSASSHDNHP